MLTVLIWTDDRWHVGGAKVGRVLFAHAEHHGRQFCVEIDTNYDQLRWPVK